MYGGTAINLFMLDAPRLSVDIDISYIGSLEKETMVFERPMIERGICEVARAQGYEPSSKSGGHAGCTFVLRYRGDWGCDHVKVDCIYMNRSPLLPVRQRTCSIRPDLDVLMFEDVELAGGKVKAFFDRIKIRDLYDISNLKYHFDERKIDESYSAYVHSSILYHASISACFPYGFEGRENRFKDKQRELDEQLLPMLWKDDDSPTLEELIESARLFVADYVLPQSSSEEEYLKLFARGEYRPDLLFDNACMVKAALESPEAQWKLENLRKMNGC